MESENFLCGICGKWAAECKKNILCTRTTINKFKRIHVEDEFGIEREFFSFSDVVEAMKVYSQIILLDSNTSIRKVLTEKHKKNEKHLEQNITLH